MQPACDEGHALLCHEHLRRASLGWQLVCGSCLCCDHRQLMSRADSCLGPSLSWAVRSCSVLGCC